MSATDEARGKDPKVYVVDPTRPGELNGGKVLVGFSSYREAVRAVPSESEFYVVRDRDLTIRERQAVFNALLNA